MELDYILIRKDGVAEKSVTEIVRDYLRKSGYMIDDRKIIISDNETVDYEIENKKGSDRYYLRISSNMYLKRARNVFETIDKILSGEINEYVSVTRAYDGLSATYCERLYRQYAIYERKLRHLILLVLTKAFGDEWIHETVTSDQQKNIKRKIKGSSISKDILEHMDLKELEDYLFLQREPDYRGFLENELSTINIASLTKEEIIDRINEMRPRSLWCKVFCDIGDEEYWKSNISNIRECRNIVAHNKKIRSEKYKATEEALKSIIRDIERAIIYTQNRDFTNENRTDILSVFAALGNFGIKLGELFSQYDFVALGEGFKNMSDNLTKLTLPRDTIENIGIAFQMLYNVQNQGIISDNVDKSNKDKVVEGER